MSFEPTVLPYRLIKCILTLTVQNHDIYQIEMVLWGSEMLLSISEHRTLVVPGIVTTGIDGPSCNLDKQRSQQSPWAWNCKQKLSVNKHVHRFNFFCHTCNFLRQQICRIYKWWINYHASWFIHWKIFRTPSVLVRPNGVCENEFPVFRDWEEGVHGNDRLFSNIPYCYDNPPPPF